MKRKLYNKFYLIIGILLITFSNIAQFKIDANSRFGFGTLYPSTAYRCHVAGNLLCTSYPANPSYELRFKVGNGWPGCEIGASSDILAFWTSEYGYNSLRASDYVKVSDSTLKFDVEPLVSVASKISLMTPLKYKMEDDKIDGESGKRLHKSKTEFGFYSQQINRIFPEINLTCKDPNGIILLDYDQLIPIAIAGIKEQQLRIDSLEKNIIHLNNLVQLLLQNNEFLEKNLNQLFPCIPNPSDNETKISYNIDSKSFRAAEIIISNSSGQTIITQSINQAGPGILSINKKQLGVGIYYISLFVNSININTQSFIFN